ncbi:MAG: hypothetical protein B7733_00635 [Myxococcales bacterium FL481]|nr:MAG: hypothetical protein B7733_00635 [Myxococcales bacterium FL481]
MPTFCSSWGLAALLCVSAVACGGEPGEEKPKPKLKKSRSLADIAAAQPKMTAEELAEARKKSGFKTDAEIAAENAAMFEKGAREYVKSRLKSYRKLVGDLRGFLDKLEKQAPKWATSGRGQKNFERFAAKYKKDTKAFVTRYDDLTAKGSEGGNTQALLGKAVRAWDDNLRDIGPELGSQSAFGELLASIRADLDKVDQALTDIEKDESLVAAKPGK